MRREEQVLHERVIESLREHGGNVAAVGRALGEAPIQIRRWCQSMQIELSQFGSRHRRYRGIGLVSIDDRCTDRVLCCSDTSIVAIFPSQDRNGFGTR